MFNFYSELLPHWEMWFKEAYHGFGGSKSVSTTPTMSILMKKSGERQIENKIGLGMN